MCEKDDNATVLSSLEPALLWKLFGQITQIPHGSGNEKALRQHLGFLALLNGLQASEDASGNLLIKVPASPGCETAPTVVLQAHLDMVCTQLPPTEANLVST
jgi:dipeptidase D